MALGNGTGLILPLAEGPSLRWSWNLKSTQADLPRSVSSAGTGEGTVTLLLSLSFHMYSSQLVGEAVWGRKERKRTLISVRHYTDGYI